MDEMGHERTWDMHSSSSIWKPPPGDFKNIPIMLQDKSLITGNYGLPICPSFYFYPLIQQEKQDAEWEGRGLLPGSSHWSWPLTLYCTSIHVEWLTCGQQLPPNDPNRALCYSRWTGLHLCCRMVVCKVLSCVDLLGMCRHRMLMLMLRKNQTSFQRTCHEMY